MATALIWGFQGAVSAGSRPEVQCDAGIYKYFALWGLHGKHFEFQAPGVGKEVENTVAKWKDDVDFLIKNELSDAKRADELQHEITALFSEFGAASGVKVTRSQKEYQNILVIISDDITRSDAALRFGVRSLLVAARGGESPNTEQILDLHHRSVAEMRPRCHGSQAHNDKEGIVGAFVYVQADQDSKCVIMAIAGAFGLMGVPEEIVQKDPLPLFKVKILSAISELYDPAIQQGMKLDEVIQVMKRRCK